MASIVLKPKLPSPESNFELPRRDDIFRCIDLRRWGNRKTFACAWNVDDSGLGNVVSVRRVPALR